MSIVIDSNLGDIYAKGLWSLESNPKKIRALIG